MSYGKSNSDHSFLKDSMYTMKTTINGQLLLSMLIEKLLMNIKSILFLQVNTDGITIKLKRTELDQCTEICKNWEDMSKLTLEYSNYKLMAIANISSYIAQYTNNDVKLKGQLEIDKELHKNPSMRIVPIAVHNYIINNIPVEETIRNHKDIYDFCLMVRVNKSFQLEYHSIVDNNINIKILPKTQRYFISHRGGGLVKMSVDIDGSTYGNPGRINVGNNVTLFNNFYQLDNFDDYGINYEFYILEAKKLINIIEPPVQMKLF